MVFQVYFSIHWNICDEEVARIVRMIVEGEESAKDINPTILVPIAKVPNLTLLFAVLPHQFMQCVLYDSLEGHCQSYELVCILPPFFMSC